MAPELRCTVAAFDGGHLVSVSGEVDMATAPRLAEAVAQFTNGSVTVDLSGVTFLDSSGLNALVAAGKYIEHRNGRLLVRDASPIVQRLFEISGLDGYLQPNGERV